MFKLSYAAPVIFLMTVFLGCSSGKITIIEESQLAQQRRINEALGQIERISAESMKLQDDFTHINDRLQELEAKANSLAAENDISLQEMEDNISFLNEQISRLDKSSMQKGTAKPVRTPPKAAGVFKPGGFDINKSYEAAYNDYNAKKYESAITGFKEILTVAPNSQLADNSQYWIGECYDALGQNENALEAFNKVFAFKPSNKIPDAHLKIGIIYLKTGKNDLAIRQFKTVITDYPNSAAAGIASAKLEALGQQ